MNVSGVARRIAIGQIRGFCNTRPAPVHNNRGSVIGLLTGLYRLHAKSWELQQERIRLFQIIATKKSHIEELKSHKQMRLEHFAFNVTLYRVVADLKLKQMRNRQQGVEAKDAFLEILLERQRAIEKMRLERKNTIDG